MNKSYLLGIDNGLTATKVVVYDLHGKEIGIVSLPTKPISNQAGYSELDMRREWGTCYSAVRQVLEKTALPADQIAAVGVSAYGNGIHLLDKRGQPLGNALTSMDHRALSLVESFPQAARQRLQALTLQDIWDAQPGILARWIKANEPEQYRQIGSILFCKDWIQYCLTGQISTEYTDISAAGLLNNQTKQYDRTILELLEIPELEGCLPPVLKSAQVAGTVTRTAATQTGLATGTPVVAGMFDVVANPIGSGLIRPGQFCTIAGTWNINITIGQRPFIPQAIRQCTIYGDEQFYAYIDSSATSASNLDWFLRNVLHVAGNYTQFEEIIGHYQPKDVEIMFLPLVHGGLRNDNPGALFYGLKSYHTRDHMLRAVAEGIGFAHHYHIQNLLHEGITKGETLILTGGASKNQAWCQIFADITQMRVTVPESDQTGALGDCIMAGVGAGVFPDIQTGMQQMVRIRKAYEPNQAHADAYQQKYARFVDVLERL